MRSYRALALVVMLWAQTASAAHLYLDAALTDTHSIRDTFYVPVRIDTGSACINAARVELGYDPAVLSVRDISIGDSILTLWTKPPTVERTDARETGHVIFEGGIPGGYCGRVEGDPGRTNILATLVVSGVAPAGGASSSAAITVLPATSVYQNDGSGSAADLTVAGADIVFVDATSTPENPWLADVKADTIAPEYFDITLVKGPSVGNQRSYIVFSTVDKQSGMDHYEVLETDPDRFGWLTFVPREARWVRAESPYVLRDQNLASKIMVKAKDKNGNERVVEYTPPMSPLTELARPTTLLPLVVLLIILIILGAFVVRLVRVHARRDVTHTQPRV